MGIGIPPQTGNGDLSVSRGDPAAGAQQNGHGDPQAVCSLFKQNTSVPSRVYPPLFIGWGERSKPSAPKEVSEASLGSNIDAHCQLRLTIGWSDRKYLVPRSCPSPQAARGQEATFGLERGGERLSAAKNPPRLLREGAAASRCGLPHGI